MQDNATGVATLSFDEQADFQATARRFLSDVADQPQALGWSAIVDLGWAGIGVPEELGGAGYGHQVRRLIAEAAGEALMGGRLWPTLGLALPLVVALGAREQSTAIVEGRRTTVGWCVNPSTPFSIAVGQTALRLEGNHLAGTVVAVPGAETAETLLVPAADNRGVASICAVSRDAFAVVETPIDYLDQTCPVSTLEVSGESELLAEGLSAVVAWAQATLGARAWLAAESWGIARRMLDLAVTHAKAREQFGKQIGSFQAVSHQLSDLYADIELAGSAVQWAARSLDAQAEDAELSTLAAISLGQHAAISGVEKAIQIFGGLGMTWESPLHRYFKRALTIQAFDAGVHEARRRVAHLLFDQPEGT